MLVVDMVHEKGFKALGNNVIVRCFDYGFGYKDCVLNYKRNWRDKFIRHPEYAQTRGTVLRIYENGEVKPVAVPFFKFFNYGEVMDNLSITPDVVMHKVDGTLIIVWRDPDEGDLRANTRGVLDVHNNPYVTAFWDVIRVRGLKEALEDIVGDDNTVMFELAVGLSCQVDPTAFDAEKTNAWILARRNLKTLELEYPFIDERFDVPPSYDVSDAEAIKEMVRTWKDYEGVVAYDRDYHYFGYDWWDGLVKFKSKLYLMSSGVLKEEKRRKKAQKKAWKKVVYLVLNGKSDDVVSEGGEVAEFVAALEERLSKLSEIISNICGRTDVPDWLLWVTKLCEDKGTDVAIKALVSQLIKSKNSPKDLLSSLDRLIKRLSS